MRIRCSINKKWRGKPKVIEGRTYDHLGLPVNTASGWRNVEGEFADIFHLIAVRGYAVCSILTGGYRCNANFDRHSLAMVDVDQGFLIEQLLADPLYVAHGGGYYVTPSHTPEAHRFRVVYVLEADVTSGDDMHALYTGLIAHYGGNADGACKGGAWYFNGTVRASRRERTDRVLPLAKMQELMDRGRALEPVRHVSRGVSRGVSSYNAKEGDALFAELEALGCLTGRTCAAYLKLYHPGERTPGDYYIYRDSPTWVHHQLRAKGMPVWEWVDRFWGVKLESRKPLWVRRREGTKTRMDDLLRRGRNT